MNFSPFGGHFPGSIPGIHQFAASGALTTSAQETVNRYHNSNVNMTTHFNQPHPPILSKFRTDETNTGNMNKYNGHNINQYTVPYTQQSDTIDNKQRISVTSTYPQTSIAGTSNQVQTPEISQDLCNAILQQQNDAKRGNYG